MIIENSLGQKINNPENFWKWFGNSIMVDNQGRPIVFYHGTDKKFTDFKSGYSNGLIFFTYDKTLADKYSKNKSINHGNYDGKRDILKCYLKINKLFVPKNDWELILDDVLEIFKFPKNIKELVNADENKLTDEEKKQVDYYHEYIYWIQTGNWIILEDTRVVERIWSKGFDAIQLSEETDGEQSTIAVKENSNQIKSIKNIGNYNSSNNIYETLSRKLARYI